jgi:hypothetical protein
MVGSLEDDDATTHTNVANNSLDETHQVRLNHWCKRGKKKLDMEKRICLELIAKA